MYYFQLLVVAWAVAVSSSMATNPFATHDFYLNPVNQASYDESIANTNDLRIGSNLQKMRGIASAYWIDKAEKIRGTSTRTVQGILADAASKADPQLVVLIWYDLPNRDCAAAASAGEICCAYKADGTCDWGAGGDCSDGINQYKSEYVDPFIEVLVEFKGLVPVVIIFEPDSLPNFATNMDKPHCGSLETRNAYTKGSAYALNELTAKTDASVYIDAAHGGWLGWTNNLAKYLDKLKELDVPFDKIRGFSTNVAGYQPLGTMCPWMPDAPYRNGFCLNSKHSDHACCIDSCSLLSQWDPAQNELNYAQELHHAAKDILGMDAHIVIDTGRNGVPGARGDCANWCNIRGAGAGHESTSRTEGGGIVDAYFYLKTPGESDGCTQGLPDGTTCPRYDLSCGSTDSIGSRAGEPRAPEAGGWFDYQVRQLADVADFGDHSQAPRPSQRVPSQAPAEPREPAQVVSPEPVLAATPQPPHSTGGSCCWGSSCAPAASWCSESQDHCVGNCNGQWHPESALASVAGATHRRASVGRHGSLRARKENVLLQQLGKLVRSDSDEL